MIALSGVVAYVVVTCALYLGALKVKHPVWGPFVFFCTWIVWVLLSVDVLALLSGPPA